MTGTSTEAHPALRLDRISKTFNRGLSSERRALQSIDLRVAPGEFVVVIGSNGAGKSTILNAIAGDFAADEGDVWISGRCVTRLNRHRRSRYVARVFQDPAKGTTTGFTVEENLALASKRAASRGFGAALTRGVRARFRDALAPLGLGLEDRLGTQVDYLSGGQRQALSLVMAIMNKPPLLLLDEHCAALDPRAAAAVMKLTIAEIARSKITTLMITHNMEHAIKHGDRLLMMHQGKILFEVSGAAKAALSVETLVQKFHVAEDELLLASRT